MVVVTLCEHTHSYVQQVDRNLETHSKNEVFFFALMLANRIAMLVTDETLRRQMGARARAKAQQFDQAVMVSRLTKEIRQMLTGGQ